MTRLVSEPLAAAGGGAIVVDTVTSVGMKVVGRPVALVTVGVEDFEVVICETALGRKVACVDECYGHVLCTAIYIFVIDM